MTGQRYMLYYDRATSAFVTHVMLEELGVAYDLQHVDTGSDAHETAAFRRINPNMLLPTLGLPDGRTFGECGATLLMLGDLHPESGMVPRIGEPDRPFFLQWLFALATTGHTTIRRYSYPSEYTTRTEAEPATSEAAWRQIDRFLTIIDDVIAGDPWFMARGFGPLDIYTVMVLLVVPAERWDSVLAGRPKLRRLLAAAHERDSINRLFAFYFGDA
ncbi:MAG: glutathione S-transferase family protein [Azospirillaceae bacterium]